MDGQMTYANKYSLVVSNKEAFISFQWVGPELDDKGTVTRERTVREQTVTMPLELAFALKNSLNEIFKEKPNESKPE